jgi:prepilin peptidase CpaA
MSRMILQIVPSSLAVLFAAAAAVCDVRTRRIPNRLVLLALATALVSQFAAWGVRGIGGAAFAGAIALLLMSIGFAFGGIGAGDVKLMAAMGTFAGLTALPLLMLCTALAGGAMAVTAILCRNSAMTTQHGVRSGRGIEPAPLTLPYAVPIACGVLAVFCNAFRSLRP